MWVFDWLQTVFSRSVALTPILSVASGLLVSSALAGYVFKDKNIFLGLVCMIVGGTCIASTAANLSYESEVVCWGGLGVIGGGCFLALIVATYVREQVERRKKTRAKIERKLHYTLPDKENTYIRERLHTALDCEEKTPDTWDEEGDFLPEGGEKNDVLRLEYVRNLLNELQKAPLTKTERLETEEMKKTFSCYLKKNKWTSGDVRAVNDLFSCLLKMAAKYSV